MGAYIVRRLLSIMPVMAVVAVFVFLLLHLAPGDPAAIMAGDNATPDNIAKIRTPARPRPAALVAVPDLDRHAAAAAISATRCSGATPSSTLDRASARSRRISLAITTLLVAVTLALVMGVAAAAQARGTWIDRLVMAFAVFGFSVPVFVVGYLLIFLFAIQLQWLPVQGYTPISRGRLARGCAT